MMKLVSVFFSIAIAVTPSAVYSQELAKFRDDYCLNPTRQYQPCDPWTRSVIWQIHTGHRGWFYNCDGEEKKRFSPYICWKNGEWPWTGESCRDSLRRDICGIKQRISDGSCECQGAHKCDRNPPCNCQHCSVKVASRDHTSDSPEFLAAISTTHQNPDRTAAAERLSYRNFVIESPPKPDPDRR